MRACGTVTHQRPLHLHSLMRCLLNLQFCTVWKLFDKTTKQMTAADDAYLQTVKVRVIILVQNLPGSRFLFTWCCWWCCHTARSFVVLRAHNLVPLCTEEMIPQEKQRRETVHFQAHVLHQMTLALRKCECLYAHNQVSWNTGIADG